jgi:putative (di)nucleoside polyphosphate hydrolase
MLTAISAKLVQGSLHFNNTKNSKYRPGVGIVLLNERGCVLVGRRIDIVQSAWQLPQGGIERGEYPSDAALRELKEEIGTDDVDIIAESKGWLTYDVPSEHSQRAWNGRWQGQRQKWFLMRYRGTDADFDLGRNAPEFSAWRWVPLSDLPFDIWKKQITLCKSPLFLFFFHALVRLSDAIIGNSDRPQGRRSRLKRVEIGFPNAIALIMVGKYGAWRMDVGLPAVPLGATNF